MPSGKAELYLGKDIVAICPHKYVGKNNCAHYVGHVLGLTFGTLCNLSRKVEKGRASIRVNEVYNALSSRGKWSDKPHLREGETLLVFVTAAKHVDSNGIMSDHPQKHIGILSGDKIYNYSNSHHKVVADTVDAFLAKFDSIYDGDDISLFYGVVA
jgi:hypothetical protein